MGGCPAFRSGNTDGFAVQASSLGLRSAKSDRAGSHERAARRKESQVTTTLHAGVDGFPRAWKWDEDGPVVTGTHLRFDEGTL